MIKRQKISEMLAYHTGLSEPGLPQPYKSMWWAVFIVAFGSNPTGWRENREFDKIIECDKEKKWIFCVKFTHSCNSHL